MTSVGPGVGTGVGTGGTVSAGSFSVAPMVGHTHRHYRAFWRLLSGHATLYTEMVSASALVAAADAPRPGDGDYLLAPCADANTVLQLGGGDEAVLAKAAAIGADLGYRSCNLNCGCPSIPVAGERQFGVALMRDPRRVASFMAAMRRGAPGCDLSVKHRLGVVDARAFDPATDSAAASSASAHEFVEEVSKECDTFIVHRRLGLLDDGSARPERNPDKSRAAYQEKKENRAWTLKNRNVPPLRRNIATTLAKSYPSKAFVVNGGVQSVVEAREIATATGLGVMVGRAAVTHPCAFSAVDEVLYPHAPFIQKPRTRGEVLEAYSEYVASVERVDMTPAECKRLVSPIFHLYNGEPCAWIFMRRLKVLVEKKLGSQISARAVIAAAALEIPREIADKPLEEYSPLGDLPNYAREAVRAGPFQRVIH